MFFGSLEGPVPACDATNQRIAWDALVVEFALVFFIRQFEEDADAMFVSSGRLVSCLLPARRGRRGSGRSMGKKRRRSSRSFVLTGGIYLLTLCRRDITYRCLGGREFLMSLS